MNSIKKWSKKLASVLLSLLMMACISLQSAKAIALDAQLKNVQKQLTGLKDNLTGLSNRLGELQTKFSSGTVGDTRSTDLKKKLDEIGIVYNDALIKKALASKPDVDDAVTWILDNPEPEKEKPELKDLSEQQKNDLLKMGFSDLTINSLTGMGFSYEQIVKVPQSQRGTVDDALNAISGNGSGTSGKDDEELKKKLQPSVIQPVIVPGLQEGVQGANLGLNNANGNDCFFSSAFQVLSQIDPFVKALEKMDKENKTSDVQNEFLAFIANLRQNAEKKEGRVVKAKYDPAINATKLFRDFIAQEKFGSLRDFGKYRFDYRRDQNKQIIYDNSIPKKAILDKTEPGYEQNDAQEFLSLFLDQLTLRVPEDNAIRKLFILHQGTELKNLTTGKTKKADIIEPSMILSLPINSKDESEEYGNLSTCLQSYLEEEKLDESEWLEWNGIKQSTSKRFEFVNDLPKILTIQFGRFKYGNMADKISHAVAFPIDLDFTGSNEIAKYHLFGIVVHGGGTGGGHYWAYTKDRFKNQDGIRKWRLYDDSRVVDVDEKNIKAIADNGVEPEELVNNGTLGVPGYEATPYMLFYEKVE